VSRFASSAGCTAPLVPKLWAGRLGEHTSPIVERYTSSVADDVRLYVEDIEGSRAHARMLLEAGLLTPAQHEALDSGLQTVLEEFEAGTFVVEPADEDVHSAVERRLHEQIGTVAGMLHAGRSRNDQVATDLRLFAKRACVALVERIIELQSVLLRRAAEHRESVMPSYTHLQRAQPVTLAHHLLAHVAMLRRDAERLLDARRRCDELPLGSGAVAGSTLPLDRARVAALLGFAAVSQNSMDAVADRDFAVEITAACALLMTHCSRIGEEIVVWTSAEFGFAALPDTHATGSSLMPQKKNADVAELARGRSARVLGDVVTLLTMLKGLPLAYNRDLQEDKRPLFDAVDTTLDTLAMLANLFEVLRFDTDAMRSAASDSDLLATDVAELLVLRGIPFRQAHEIVGSLVRRTHTDGRSLADLSAAEWEAASGGAAPDFDLDAALRRRKTLGGPAPEETARQMDAARRRVEQLRTALDGMR